MSEQKQFFWRIRVEGIGNYPRCKSPKRKTMAAISTKQGIQERANNLKKFGGYKIIWIKNIGEHQEKQKGAIKKQINPPLKCPKCSENLIQADFNLWICENPECETEWDADELGINAEEYP